jgi:ubiquinone/menaquinone biosynthesis C-methylase UbiE
MGETSAARLGALIQDLVRELTAGTPPPRALPYLGLEHASGTGLHLLEALSTRGVFRKYELVLELGTGLGGSARYLAGRLGCDVVAHTTSAGDAVAAATLGRRTAFHARVRVTAARADNLPFRPARFTHVWIVEALPQLPDAAAALGEAHRVLRPGGYLAVQELALPARDGDVPVHGWRFGSATERVDQIEAAGFVDIQHRDVTAEATERSPRVLAAREHLLRRLRADPLLAAVAAEREALATAVTGGRLRVVQLLARRP